MGTPASTVMFHVMKRGEHIVIFRMKANGDRSVFLPAKKPIDQAWPAYDRAAPYLEAWFKSTNRDLRKRGQPVRAGDDEYPKMLAQALTRDDMLRLWAYVTPPTVNVSLRQIAQALGKKPGPALRQELETKGLHFTQADNGSFEASLGAILRLLGQDTADRILLYPRHVADYLGVSHVGASQIVRRLGIALDREDTTVVEWGKLRRVKRTGPRKFEMGQVGEAVA